MRGVDEFSACRRNVSPVQGHPGLHRADQQVPLPGLAQHRDGLPGQYLGLVPFPAGHGHQRAFAQRLRQSLGCAEVPDGDGVLEGRVAGLEVTAQDVRDPLHERGCRYHGARRRGPASPKTKAGPVTVARRLVTISTTVMTGNGIASLPSLRTVCRILSF